MRTFIFAAALLAISTTAFADTKGLARAVDQLSAAAESGVTKGRFFELLGNATQQASGFCETPEDAKRNPNWYCIAYLQFKTVGMSWYALETPDKASLDAAVRAAKIAKKTGGKVSR